jgi:hypothetical protein
MLRMLLAVFSLAGLLALSATPALASGIMSAGVLLSCASYTFIAQAWNLTPGSRDGFDRGESSPLHAFPSPPSILFRQFGAVLAATILRE